MASSHWKWTDWLKALPQLWGDADHAEEFGEVADLHAGGDAADVVDDEADGVDGAAADVLGIVVGGEEELADVERHVYLGGELDEAVDVGGGEGIFEGDVAELVEFAANFEGLAAVVDADGVEHEDEVVADGLADGFADFNV
jgi:hypothetical protein